MRPSSLFSVANTTGISSEIKKVYDFLSKCTAVVMKCVWPWTGSEWQAVVEFAPYQKMPPEKKKVDNRNATIEKGDVCLLPISPWAHGAGKTR
jgi:hypothetical protein